MFPFSPVFLILAAVLILVAAGGMIIFRRKVKDMALLEFLGRLVRARGVQTMTARQLARELESEAPPLILDVREPARAPRPTIPTALAIPFDDLLREVVVNGRFTEDRDRPIVIVCDHGNVSRVAGDVLAKDEGFTRVASVRGGMTAWRLFDRARQRGARGGGSLRRLITGGL